MCVGTKQEQNIIELSEEKVWLWNAPFFQIVTEFWIVEVGWEGTVNNLMGVSSAGRFPVSSWALQCSDQA